MEIVITRENDVSVCSIRGRLDAVSAPELEKQLDQWFEQAGNKLIFDLAELEYVSSAGLRIFLTAAKRMKTCNGKLGMACLRKGVRDVFAISGFIALIPAFDTLEAANKSIR
jgi:stage II sporulation protein AA (anti-sigma F factor antagonist)